MTRGKTTQSYPQGGAVGRIDDVKDFLGSRQNPAHASAIAVHIAVVDCLCSMSKSFGSEQMLLVTHHERQYEVCAGAPQSALGKSPINRGNTHTNPRLRAVHVPQRKCVMCRREPCRAVNTRPGHNGLYCEPGLNTKERM